MPFSLILVFLFRDFNYTYLVTSLLINILVTFPLVVLLLFFISLGFLIFSFIWSSFSSKVLYVMCIDFLSSSFYLVISEMVTIFLTLSWVLLPDFSYFTLLVNFSFLSYMIFSILLAGSEVLVYNLFFFLSMSISYVGSCWMACVETAWALAWSSTRSCPHRGVGGWGHGTLETQQPLETSSQSQFWASDWKRMEQRECWQDGGLSEVQQILPKEGMSSKLERGAGTWPTPLYSSISPINICLYSEF